MDSKCRETNARVERSTVVAVVVFVVSAVAFSCFSLFSIFYKDVSTIMDSSFLILTELMTLLQLICDPVK